MKDVPSLNQSKGTTINELELTLIALKKLLKQKVAASPSAGLRLNKGQPNEAKLKYKDMITVLDSLQGKLSMEGCFSLGICKTCTRFNPRASGRGCFGLCKDKVVHEYYSCDQHSKKGGGYGV